MISQNLTFLKHSMIPETVKLYKNFQMKLTDWFLKSSAFMNCSSENSRIIFNQFSLASHQPFFKKKVFSFFQLRQLSLKFKKGKIFYDFYILNVAQAAQF